MNVAFLCLGAMGAPALFDRRYPELQARGHGRNDTSSLVTLLD